jgi:hypothetical protein
MKKNKDTVPDKEDKTTKYAQLLRDNLRKRKTQQRGR